MGWLRAHGIEVKGEIVDTMIAEPMRKDNLQISLAKIILVKAAETDLKKQQKVWCGSEGDVEATAEHVGHYAEQDVKLTYLCKVELHK